MEEERETSRCRRFFELVLLSVISFIVIGVIVMVIGIICNETSCEKQSSNFIISGFIISTFPCCLFVGIIPILSAYVCFRSIPNRLILRQEPINI